MEIHGVENVTFVVGLCFAGFVTLLMLLLVSGDRE
jgi:hypothetical protein